MKSNTYLALEKIYEKYKNKKNEHGKIFQLLLALAFESAGFTVKEVRTVEGVDLDVISPEGEKYAIEVKTTASKTISNFEKKDIEGLQRRKEDGYQPVLAALAFTSPLSDWIFARADELKSDNIHIDLLRAYRLNKFEEKVNLCFEEVVNEHFFNIMKEGLGYLINALKDKRIKVER